RMQGWNTVHVTSAKQGVTAEARETSRGFEFYRTPPTTAAWTRLPSCGQLAVVTSLRPRIRGIIAAERPVLVHVHSPCLNALAALPVAAAAGIPVVYEIRAIWEDGAVDSGSCREGDLRYRLSRWLETHACRKATRVVTISAALKREIEGRGIAGDRINVVPNSVDIERFTAAPQPYDAAEGARLGLSAGHTLGFIGTFFPYEGLEVLIRAVPALRARLPQVKVLLVGDGPEMASLQELAQNLGVGEAVVFTGRVDHASVERYYSLVDILVYPRVSKRVTELVTPLKPLEAMAQRKFVVASDVGGHREMIEDGETGVLFSPGDPKALAEACLGILEDRDGALPLLDRARHYVESERDWKRNARLYDDVYERCIGR
ncbi:MAG: glycosyltransferase, exosortase A system-associated, partial [Pseudomonadales bacterium]|nr:glycosyltransferase, exosortase A system-associated [Pseudomonadales bacterium]